VLAVIWSAVVLPSGAAAAFALTAHDPPFLSHVATEKSSEYLAMFSYGPPTVPNGPHSMELKCESRYAHRLLAAAYANDAPPSPSRRTSVLAAAAAVPDVRALSSVPEVMLVTSWLPETANVAENRVRRGSDFGKGERGTVPVPTSPHSVAPFSIEIWHNQFPRRVKRMSVIDEVLVVSEQFAKSFNYASLAMPPKRKLAVLACMDARLAIDQLLGLRPGDAHVIRNAGGIVTGDAVRSLVISHYLLGTQEFMIINHTDCGMLTFKDEDLRGRLEHETGIPAISPSVFHAFTDVEENVRKQITRLRAHPWVPRSVSIRGFVYNVGNGRLGEVRETKTLHA